jgi:hypothetical protein
MQIVLCEVGMVKIPMGEDTLTLVRGDRLLLFRVGNSNMVTAINESPVKKPFRIREKAIRELMRSPHK